MPEVNAKVSRSQSRKGFVILSEAKNDKGSGFVALDTSNQRSNISRMHNHYQ